MDRKLLVARALEKYTNPQEPAKARPEDLIDDKTRTMDHIQQSIVKDVTTLEVQTANLLAGISRELILNQRIDPDCPSADMEIRLQPQLQKLISLKPERKVFLQQNHRAFIREQRSKLRRILLSPYMKQAEELTEASLEPYGQNRVFPKLRLEMINSRLQTAIFPEQVDKAGCDMVELGMTMMPNTREMASIRKINPDETSAGDESSMQIQTEVLTQEGFPRLRGASVPSPSTDILGAIAPSPGIRWIWVRAPWLSPYDSYSACHGPDRGAQREHGMIRSKVTPHGDAATPLTGKRILPTVLHMSYSDKLASTTSLIARLIIGWNDNQDTCKRKLRLGDLKKAE